MKQLSLNITPRYAYQARQFILHSGVADVAQESLQSVFEQPNKPSFSAHYILGEAQSGKTHLSVYLASQIQNRSLPYQLIDGQSCVEQGALSPLELDQDRPGCVLIDDADLLIDSLGEAASSAFVALWEKLKLSAGALLLFASKTPDQLVCDDHVASRVRACGVLQLGHPAPEDMELCLKALANQRGLFLSDHTLRVAARRLPRTFSAISLYLSRLQQLSESLDRPISYRLAVDAL